MVDPIGKLFIVYSIFIFLSSVAYTLIFLKASYKASLFKSVAKKNKILAYILSIFTFAGIHFISSLSVLLINLNEPTVLNEVAYQVFYDDLKTLTIYIVAAIVLTISYDVNKNIATNIMVHAFYNLSQVIIMLLFMFIVNNNPESLSYISNILWFI